MKFIFIYFFSIFFLFSCSQKNENLITEIQGDSIEEQMRLAYNDGLSALEKGDVLYAAKKFNEAEMLYPQSEWAPRSSLMAAYSYWSQQYYRQSIDELKRFLTLYKNHPNSNYAHYLLGINYYDSIINEKNDLRPLIESKKYFTILVDEFPNSDYALDAKYKLELIEDLMAAKEMYIARHYIKKQKWIAAINRLKKVIRDYSTTIFVEEALFRITEIYYIIGLDNEAKKYASVLGYNYQSSEWYKKSYQIFNKNYETLQLQKDNFDQKDTLLDKIKIFFK
jgi:outer membrane protein assembly factor BamD